MIEEAQEVTEATTIMIEITEMIMITDPIVTLDPRLVNLMWSGDIRLNSNLMIMTSKHPIVHTKNKLILPATENIKHNHRYRSSNLTINHNMILEEEERSARKRDEDGRGEMRRHDAMRGLTRREETGRTRRAEPNKSEPR